MDIPSTSDRAGFKVETGVNKALTLAFAAYYSIRCLSMIYPISSEIKYTLNELDGF